MTSSCAFFQNSYDPHTGVIEREFIAGQTGFQMMKAGASLSLLPAPEQLVKLHRTTSDIYARTGINFDIHSGNMIWSEEKDRWILVDLGPMPKIGAVQQFVIKDACDAAPDPPQVVARGTHEIGHRADASLVKSTLHARADAVNVGQVEAVQNVGQIILGNDDQAVRLLHVATDLTEEQAGSKPDRAGHAVANQFADGPLDLVRQFPCRRDLTLTPHQAARHFVNRTDFLDWKARIDGGDDAVVVLDIKLVPRLNQHEVRAAFFGLPYRRASFDAERSGFVTGGNGARAIRHHLNNRHWTTAQLRTILLFAGREIAVEVEEEPVDPAILGIVGHHNVHVAFLLHHVHRYKIKAIAEKGRHLNSSRQKLFDSFLPFMNPLLFCLIFAAQLPLGEKGGIGKSL
jgi:hypothetical protein